MISYISIDRIEGDFVVCELEMIELEDSRPEDYETKETKMVMVPMKEFSDFQFVKEGDIFVVIHEGENVMAICYKDDKQKAKRIEIMKTILQ